jgi:hypothetical protein
MQGCHKFANEASNDCGKPCYSELDYVEPN